jgi:hypothetical protein
MLQDDFLIGGTKGLRCVHVYMFIAMDKKSFIFMHLLIILFSLVMIIESKINEFREQVSTTEPLWNTNEILSNKADIVLFSVRFSLKGTESDQPTKVRPVRLT